MGFLSRGKGGGDAVRSVLRIGWGVVGVCTWVLDGQSYSNPTTWLSGQMKYGDWWKGGDVAKYLHDLHVVPVLIYLISQSRVAQLFISRVY